jgi:hypothetical protein
MISPGGGVVGCDVGASGAMEYEEVFKHDFLRKRAW